MDIIVYYAEYRELKAHFNSNGFLYKESDLPITFLWNREQSKALHYFQKFQFKYTLEVFKQLLISSFVFDPKMYFMALENKKNLERFKQFQIWWSNPLYYFKKDLENIESEKDEHINTETYVLLVKLFDIIPDWMDNECRKLVYDKYFYLMLMYIKNDINKIKKDIDVKNLIKKIEGDIK